jgi:hypothetical protein
MKIAGYCFNDGKQRGLMETLRNTGERIKRNDGDLVVERVLLMAGVYHPQVLKTQVLNGSVQDSEL